MAENYTTYVEDDVSGVLTVAPTTIDATAIRRDTEAKVVKDFGAGFFGDISLGIIFDGRITADSISSSFGIFKLSDQDSFESDSRPLVSVYFNRGSSGSRDIILQAFDSATGTDFDKFIGYSLNTWDYFNYTRSGTTNTLKIYSDSDKTTLIDTLVVAMANPSSRYLYGAGGVKQPGAATMTGTVANLELLDFIVTATGGSHFVELQGMVW